MQRPPAPASGRHKKRHLRTQAERKPIKQKRPEAFFALRRNNPKNRRARQHPCRDRVLQIHKVAAHGCEPEQSLSKEKHPFTPRRAAVVFHALHTQALPDARQTLHCTSLVQKSAPSRAARSSSTSTVLLYPTAQILPNWQKSKTRRIPGSKAPGTTAQAMLPADTTAAWYVRPAYWNIRRTEYLLSAHRHSNHNKSQSAPLKSPPGSEPSQATVCNFRVFSKTAYQP